MASRSEPRAGAPDRPRRARGAFGPEIVVVGFGRVGGALALGLSRAGWQVRVHARSAAARTRSRKAGLGLADAERLAAAGICVLAVPDAKVAPLSRELAPRLGPRCALVHCAGALPLSALEGAGGRPRGSLHPLVAISAPEDPLEGNAAAIAATSPTLRRWLARMAKDLGLRPLEVPEAGRAAYHAGAVLAAGGLVALAHAAVRALREAGISDRDALGALLPLMRSALRGVERRGLSAGLTGPVPRGDVEGVVGHLDVLPGDVRRLYVLLSERMVDVAGDHLSEPTRRALLRALSG